MGRPRKSTRDEWLDTFADWDALSREKAMDLCDFIHRQAIRRELRNSAAAMAMAKAVEDNIFGAAKPTDEHVAAEAGGITR